MIATKVVILFNIGQIQQTFIGFRFMIAFKAEILLI